MTDWLQPAAIFSDDMVLQRGKPIPVWGKGKPGERVLASLDGRYVAVHAEHGGEWKLSLPAMPAGGPYTLTLRSGTESISYHRVYLGDVWLAGGQSNMELELQNSENGKWELANCQNPMLHFYNTPKVPYCGAELEKAERESHWRVVGPDTAATMSAVAYYAGKKLTENLKDIHIGILDCYWGGTSVASWTSRETLAKTPEGQRRLAEYEALIGDKTEARYDAELSAYNAAVQTWNGTCNTLKTENPQVGWDVINEKAGLFPWPPPPGKRAYQRPGNLYESMLRRVCPYAICGFWYYQAEQDEEHAEDYAALLRGLIAQWRSDWCDVYANLPFYIVQLPMFGGGKTWPTLRAAQSRLSRETANSGLVVLADCGEEDNIHPVDKRTPGTRLALFVLECFYGKPVQGRSPHCVEVVIPGNVKTAAARYIHTGGGLAKAAHCAGFEIKDDSGNWKAADAAVNEDHVVIHTDTTIHGVRYAWYGWGASELHGGTGLAAEPFCFENGEFV